MKKDIDFGEVKDVGIAIVKSSEEYWETYIINGKNEPIENVMISSKASGTINNTEKVSSVLRHFFDLVPAKQVQKVENVLPDMLKLSNQYLLSFYIDGKLFDKKYIFFPKDDIKPSKIAVLNKVGYEIW